MKFLYKIKQSVFGKSTKKRRTGKHFTRTNKHGKSKRRKMRGG